MSTSQSNRWVRTINSWYHRHKRDLPWRDGQTTPWGVLVSEVMLQQTPVARVEPVWHEWMERWPTPNALSNASTAEVLRAWGRLGYPRRALRLHECATEITNRYGGELPSSEETLLTLPGVGEYTAAAVVAFAFGQRSVVVDTNVRRVQARLVTGTQFPAASLSAAERVLAASLVPATVATSVTWNVAVMELGALICTARSPRCDQCPVRTTCAWFTAGQPENTTTRKRRQTFEGTDRQCRGIIMEALRNADSAINRRDLSSSWHDEAQFNACVNSLLADGLICTTNGGALEFPN